MVCTSLTMLFCAAVTTLSTAEVLDDLFVAGTEQDRTVVCSSRMCSGQNRLSSTIYNVSALDLLRSASRGRTLLFEVLDNVAQCLLHQSNAVHVTYLAHVHTSLTAESSSIFCCKSSNMPGCMTLAPPPVAMLLCARSESCGVAVGEKQTGCR